MHQQRPRRVKVFCRVVVATLSLPSCSTAHGSRATSSVPSVTAVHSVESVESESVEEWCSLIEEIDALFEQTDGSAAAFEVKQVSYARIGELFAQLESGLDVFDSDDRRAVATDIAFGVKIVEAFTQAADMKEAEAALEAIVQNPLVGDGVQARIQLCGG